MSARGTSYRTRAPGAEIQEDLFKAKKPTGAGSSKKGGVPTDAVVLSSTEIERMKGLALASKRPEEGTRDLAMSRTQKEAASQARKERMLAMEEQRKKVRVCVVRTRKSATQVVGHW